MAIIPILLAQLSILWRNPAGNLLRARALASDLEGDSSRILILPEMFSTGFTNDLQGLAEPPMGPWETDLHAFLREKSLPCLYGVARQQAGGTITNDAVFFDPATDAAAPAYQKIRPFRSEHQVVTPGTAVTTFAHQGAIFCPLICYDLRFPELFRAGLRQGAEVFIVIASWPSARQHHWVQLLKARAIENQAFVIGVNRCGDDPNFHYAGGSMVIDPLGDVIDHADDQESVTTVEIDVARVRDWREEFPATRDYLREPDLG